MASYERYHITLGKHHPSIYAIRKGQDRYPNVLPERLIRDFEIAHNRNNERLRKFKRSRNWHDERREFRQKWGIPENGVSPRKLEVWLEEWYRQLYEERCSGDSKSYGRLLNEFDLDIDKIVEKHKLGRIPFVGANLEKYMFLNSRYYSRYCRYEWKYFSGYIFKDDKSKPESIVLSPYYKLPHSLKLILLDMIKNGIPKDSDFILETRGYPLGLAWRLISKSCRPT